MIILVEPAELSTVRNPVALIVQSTLAVVYVRITVESALYAGDFAQKAILLDSSPDAANRCEFYLQNALRSQLGYDAPSATGAVFCLQLCKRYILEIAELTEEQILEDAVWQALPIKYALLSGFERQDFPGRADLAPNENNTLEHRPNKRRLARQGPDFLTFLFPADTSLSLRYVDDTTEQTVAFGLVRKWAPVHVPIGHSQIAFSGTNTDRQVFLGASRLLNCAVRRGSADLVLLYYNTKGGLASLPVFGQIQAAIQIEADTFRHYQPYDYTPSAPVLRKYNREKFGSRTVQTGHFATQAELTAAAEIIQSEAVWLWAPGQPITPVLLTTNRATFLDKYDPLQGLALEFRDAFVS